MKGELTIEHFNFFEEALTAFEEDEKLQTYRDKDNKFIALRRGVARDCVQVFKLDGEIAFLHNIIEK